MPHTRLLTVPAFVAAVLILAAFGGCKTVSTEKGTASVSPPSATATLKVSVTYRERMLLPPGCTLFLELQNISQLNPEDNGVASAFIPVKAAPPFKAVIRYDPSKIFERLHYTVSARIKLKGQVLFSGSTRIDPLSWPEGEPVEITVTMPQR